MKGNSLNPAMNRQLEPDTRRESPCVGGSSPVSDSEGLLGDRVSLEKKSGEEIKRQESGRVYSAPCCQEHKKRARKAIRRCRAQLLQVFIL